MMLRLARFEYRKNKVIFFSKMNYRLGFMNSIPEEGFVLKYLFKEDCIYILSLKIKNIETYILPLLSHEILHQVLSISEDIQTSVDLDSFFANSQLDGYMGDSILFPSEYIYDAKAMVLSRLRQEYSDHLRRNHFIRGG